MANTKSVKTVENTDTNSNKKIEKLEKELNEYKGLVEQLLCQLKNNKSESVERKELNPNRLIKIISLWPGTLVLSNRNGRQWSFPKFGAIHQIPALDLLEIISMPNNYAQKGFYYITDEIFIEENGLSDIYKTVVPYDVINSLLTKSDKEFGSILENLSEAQFNTVFSIIVYKIQEQGGFSTLSENKTKIIEKQYKNKTNQKIDLEEYLEDLDFVTPSNLKPKK